MKDNNYKIPNRELSSLLIGRPGGHTAIKILDELLSKPQNAHQLAKQLGLNYKTITYHMTILCNHELAVKEKFEKYTYYYPSAKLLKLIDEYNYIKENNNQ